MAVGETTDDTKGVNNMWYIILSLTCSFSIVIGKDMLKYMKLGFKPDLAEIILFTLSAYVSVSLFGLAIYCLI